MLIKGLFALRVYDFLKKVHLYILIQDYMAIRDLRVPTFFYTRVEEFSCIFNRKTKYDLRKNERLLFVELRSTQSSYFNVYCQQHV